MPIWIAEDPIQAGRNPEQHGLRGRDFRYTETAILTMLTLKAVFHLPLRATAGCAAAIMRLARIALPVPDHRTRSRRRKTLTVPLPRERRDEPLHGVVDSRGLQIYGEGEWNVRQHGYHKRRTWRKMHLGGDEATHAIVACGVPAHPEADSTVVAQVLEQVDGPIAQVRTAGASDTEGCSGAITARGAPAVMPPRADAVLKRGPEWAARTAPWERVWAMGRAAGQVATNDQRRSRAAPAVFRLTTICGDHLRSRTTEGQQTAGAIRGAARNRMTRLGMPDTVRVNAG